jgi:CubicO group peptidase (beta-lactamase class C family)
MVFLLTPLSPLLAAVTGTPRFGFVMVRPRAADLATVADLVARGLLRMPIAERFPLDRADDAYRALQRHGVPGKRVVTVAWSGPDAAAAARHPEASMSPVPTIRERVEMLLAGQRIPGASIAVVDRGGIRWADGFGFADIATSRPARRDTVYHLFSGTKLFTAVAVLQLVERGLLSLDEEIGRRLPEAAHLSGVTVAHLLSHRSGLRDTMRGFLATTFPDAPRPTAEEALRGYRLRAARAPGQRVEYRNVNYALLGVLIERVTGEAFPAYVERHVLRPLGMAGGFTLSGAERERLATGYMERFDPMRAVLHLLHPSVSRRLYAEPTGPLVPLAEYDLSTAAIGGLLGSVEDFARFLHAQLTDGGGVLSSGSLQTMQRMVAEGAAGIESRVGVGLGWKVGRSGDRTFLNHEGAGAGFTSELRLYPNEGIGIAIAMNAMRMPRTMRLAHRIAEAVLAEQLTPSAAPSSAGTAVPA